MGEYLKTPGDKQYGPVLTEGEVGTSLDDGQYEQKPEIRENDKGSAEREDR